MYELVYTSVPRGLLLGRSGFCPVAWTQGMPANFVPLLDRMDSYIHQLPEQAWDEAATCYSCRYCKLGRKSIVLISRIAASGLDFQGKRNKIAHHFIFDDPQEYAALPEGGISVCLADENFLNRWEQPPGLLPPFSPQTRSLSSSFAQQWESITGDAGWAGVIAEFFLRGESPGFYVAYPLGAPDRIILELIAEVARLLPKDRLAKFTFSTLFVQTPINWDCFLRFCLPDSPLLIPLQQNKARHFLSFTDPFPVPLEWQDWPLVKQARKGLLPREDQVAEMIIPAATPLSPVAAAILGEETENPTAHTLKKSHKALLNFVTAAGQNAAAAKSRYSRLLLCIAGVLFLGLLSVLWYYTHSLMSLEKELAEAHAVVLPTAVAKADEAPPAQPEATLAFPEHGHVTLQNWVPVYVMSSDEEHYGKDFEIWIGALSVQEFLSFPLADCIRRWNRLVPQFAELEQKLTLLQLKSKEEIRRFDSQAQMRPFLLADWLLLKERIATLLQNPSVLPDEELLGLLNEAVSMLYEYAFDIFYQKAGMASNAAARKSWKEECQQMQVFLQKASGIFSIDNELKQNLLRCQEIFEKLPEYSLAMREYSQQAGELKKIFDELQDQQSPQREKLSDFAEKTYSTEFFRKYLEGNLEIPCQERQYQELATLLNQRISYR
jgi:hypothetical protein